MKTRSLLFTAFLSALSPALNAEDVTGKWKSDFDTPVGHLNYTYELKADGEKLTGKATRERDGETTEIELKEGKVSTNEVSFVEPLIFDDQEIRIEYKGKLAGDEIKFTRKVGDFATTEIIAKRVKAPSIAGKWQAEFDTEIGKQKYVYDFKVDGEKLTGRAIGDIAGEKSDTEIKDGRIVGSEVSFVEMVDFQGQQVRVAYKGKLANDELKLTRQVEDVATEELLAKRVKADEAK